MSSTVTVWHDEEYFLAQLKTTKWGVTYGFPISSLAKGASLAGMMNTRVKDTLQNGGWSVDRDELRALSKRAVKELRTIIEPYFTNIGIGDD